MSGFWITLFIFLLIIVGIFYNYSLNKNRKIKARHEQQNILEEKEVIHLSGHPYLKENDKVFFQIRKNNTVYFYKENIAEIEVPTGDEIPISNLKRYEVKTQTEISKDVTLGRLLALGVFAFVVKKNTKVEDKYLLIEYAQNDVDILCVFRQINEFTKVSDLISTLNRIRIETNTKECAV